VSSTNEPTEPSTEPVSHEYAPGYVLGAFLDEGPTDLVGEWLRWQTFVGRGLGCYENFDVREDAKRWTRDERVIYWHDLVDPESVEEIADAGKGYTYCLYADGDNCILIDVVWYWDGDGVLEFRVGDNHRIIRKVVNNDCKKSYRWVDES
jgi:hypothetical protein